MLVSPSSYGDSVFWWCPWVTVSDSTTSQIEEISETYGKVCDDVPEEDDFDSLLRMYQNEHRR